MDSLPQNQRERLNYLEFRVFFTGQISRSDLIKRFGISEAAATRDLATYREKVPRNIELDPVAKHYRIQPGFALTFIKDVAPKLVLRALVHGLGDDFGTTPSTLIPCELPPRLSAPDIDTLATISRAIFQQKAIRIRYLSNSGGDGPRELVPHCLAGNGLRWHVRAFNRQKSRFSDFVINRIASAEIIEDSKPEPHETREHDDDWNRMVVLELVPHPDKLELRERTEDEYGMVDGVLTFKVRGALVGYVLQLWNVDCSPNHSMSANYCTLWLRNSMALYGLSNAELAPGYPQKQK
jgi:predicted DNA-binding transcriptional regulator YafY